MPRQDRGSFDIRRRPSAPTNTDSAQVTQRLNQLDEEKAHTESTDSAVKDLLKDKLARLRHHVRIVEATNWRFDRKDLFKR